MAISLCGAIIVLALISGSVWASLVLVPIIGIVALPAVVFCLLVLVYAIPTMAYLLLAQSDPPSHVKWLFLPVNPVRNIGLTIAVLQYLNIMAHIVPRLIYYTAKYVVWEPISRKLSDAAYERNAVAASGGGREGIAVGTEEVKVKGILRGPNKAAPHDSRRRDYCDSAVNDRCHTERRGEREAKITWKPSSRNGGLFEDFAEFNILYHTRKDGSKARLDIYFPPAPALTPTLSPTSSPPSPSHVNDGYPGGRACDLAFETVLAHSAVSGSRAPDTDVDRQEGGGPESPMARQESAYDNDPTTNIDVKDVPATEATQHTLFSCPPGRHTSPALFHDESSDNETLPRSRPGWFGTALHDSAREVEDDDGSKVIVFVYDTGMIGPKWLRPRKEYFALLGAKLADMGYVVVIPDISLYPDGGIENSVADLRNVLAWIKRNTHRYGGFDRSIYLMGHGLGAHLALYTISQEVIVRSRDEYIHEMQDSHRHRDSPSSAATIGRSKWRPNTLNTTRDSSESLGSVSSRNGSSLDLINHSYSSNTSGKRKAGASRFSHHRQVHPSQMHTTEGAIEGYDNLIPNGLRDLQVYGGEVEIPQVKGLILLSPISDVIKQIRYESTRWLEHLSPLRRSHGPSQMTCMRHSVGHLFFASKAFLKVDMMPRVLIIHGARDIMIPLDSSHWLSELLYGLDVPAIFRPYRNLGHWDLLFGFMRGFDGGDGLRPEALEKMDKLESRNSDHAQKQDSDKVKGKGGEKWQEMKRRDKYQRMVPEVDSAKAQSPSNKPALTEDWTWQKTGYTAWLERDRKS
ncbi:hypothetical protein IAU59_001208 [Kwoniella sp. CBS 9459]